MYTIHRENMNNMKEVIKNILIQKFGETGETTSVFRAPARINIIGEHVDYLGGYVLPAAIDYYVYVSIRKNNLRQFRVYSKQFDNLVVSESLESNKQVDWVNYIYGVINEIFILGHVITGFDMVIDGNIPTGAGLSSSAALEVVVVYALSEIFGLQIPREEIAVIGQRAENNFVGVNCGIMDQFIIANGKDNSCLLLQTDSLEYSYIPLDLGDVGFYLINSEVKHSLKDSEYNERRKECDTALNKIKDKYKELENLYNLDVLSDLKQFGFKPNEQKRVGHVLGEKARTKKVIAAISKKDAKTIGDCLFQTHNSLSEKFEVSCVETDFLVQELKRLGVLGARMMGGGFGGCVLVLDFKNNFEPIQKEIQRTYSQKTGLNPRFYHFEICNGVEYA
ncbi:MAG: galactokinase [Leptospiraceae bacterium]|nr:galactokinase [Leptospiraceae bacterium]MCP5497435.1 galactokinase [Leptospiraceae bacterium]